MVEGTLATAVVVLLVTAAAFLVPRIVSWVFRQSLPQTDGSLAVDGAEGSIEIIRDVDGVPHIYAATPPDAYFGLGFVHAQDRLWQMECQRRLASGRLSEIFGSRSLPADRLLRTFGLRRAAQSALDSLPADARAAVEAYARGINACLSRQRGLTRPPELLLLRVRPDRWEPVDVLACAKLTAWQLNFTYAAELLYADLVERVGRERASMVLTFADEPSPSTAARPAEAPRPHPLDDEASEAVAPAGGREGFGSNAWVVDGTRSATRSPVLACDPHLPSGAPSSWYVAHVSGGSLDAIGATLPGIPGIVAGRNRRIAWGTANLAADVQDLFRERLSPDGRHVQCGDRMEPLTCIDEAIRVRWRRKAVPMTVRVTPRGPLISDALNATRGQTRLSGAADREPLALRWTALDGADTTLSAVLALSQARDWSGVRDALRQYVAPPIAFSYADADGHIGLQVAGRIPVRASGDGSIPGEGWTGASDWAGSVPFDDMPRMHDPAAGFVVAANAGITPAESGCFLGRAIVEPYRQRRIAELLAARPRLELRHHLVIQADTVSVHARALLPDLLPFVTAETRREADAVSILRAWDFDMHAQSVAAAIFAAWWLRLPRALVEPEIGSRLYRAFEGWVSCVDRFVRNTLREAQASGDAGARAQCAEIVQESFRRALTDLEQRLGPDLRAWQWGRVHRAVFPHTPFHQVPWLRRWFSRSVATGGDWSTISVGGTWTIARPFEQRYVAGYRQVIDLSARDGGQFIHPMGQSGHVLSPHYDDYLADWAACRTRPMRLARATVERAQRSVLWLRPRSATAPPRRDERASPP